MDNFFVYHVTHFTLSRNDICICFVNKANIKAGKLLVTYNNGFQPMFRETAVFREISSAVPQSSLDPYPTAVPRDTGFAQQDAKRAPDFHVSTIVIDRSSITQ